MDLSFLCCGTTSLALCFDCSIGTEVVTRWHFSCLFWFQPEILLPSQKWWDYLFFLKSLSVNLVRINMDLAAKSRLCQWFYHLLPYLLTACSFYIIITPANSLFLNLTALFCILVSIGHASRSNCNCYGAYRYNKVEYMLYWTHSSYLGAILFDSYWLLCHH